MASTGDPDSISDRSAGSLESTERTGDGLDRHGSGRSAAGSRESSRVETERVETERVESERVDVELSPGELIDRHQRGVWRYLRMLGCDSSTADDLTQETFLRVLRRENFVQHSEAATSSYLRRTAYNLLVSMHRKQSRMHTTPDASAIDEIWNRWAGKDLAGDLAVDILRGCLELLSFATATRE